MIITIIISVRVCSYASSADCAAESANCTLQVLGQCYIDAFGAYAIISQADPSSLYTVTFVESCMNTSVIGPALTVGRGTCFAPSSSPENSKQV